MYFLPNSCFRTYCPYVSTYKLAKGALILLHVNVNINHVYYFVTNVHAGCSSLQDVLL